MRTAIQGVIVAVKKKSAAKKVAKKAPAKKAAAKKKTTAKRAVKKAPAKKVATKKAAKKTAKKSPAKRVVKKSTSKTSTLRVSIPPVPVSSTRPTTPSIQTVPAAPAETKTFATKPVAAPKQGASSRVVFAVVVGIVLLAAIVWSKSGSKGDEVAEPAPSISQSAEPTESASATPSESASAVASIEAPSKFVALKSADGLNLRWIAPTATDGLTGYNVETRANGIGDWTVIATVPANQLTQAVSKNGDTGWTQFRVSSVYSDGQTASATVFGIPGEFK